jgi:D-amino-acid oxidase
MEAVVVGAGVIGLTCALRLLEAGFRVRVVARDGPERSTSSIAGAMWFPYEVEPEERVVPWALRTLEVFRELAQVDGTGVTIRSGMELFDERTPRPRWLAAVDPEELAPDELEPPYLDGYRFTIPLIEMPIYLDWLVRRLEELGGSIHVGESGEVASFDELDAGGPGGLVVNCTGLGAGELCDDAEVFPIQGQLVRVPQFGVSRCTVFRRNDAEFGYVIPRSNDVVLGGTTERGAWSREPDDAVTADILRLCSMHEPEVANIDPSEVVVGLRPGRTTVRLESERLSSGRYVIHCYGHGGAGVTLSVGCAEEVVRTALAHVNA